jgi:hypothetical protein
MHQTNGKLIQTKRRESAPDQINHTISDSYIVVSRYGNSALHKPVAKYTHSCVTETAKK